MVTSARSCIMEAAVCSERTCPARCCMTTKFESIPGGNDGN